MCAFGFESLFDRVGGAEPETSSSVAAVWSSGDGDTGHLAPVSRDGVEAVHTAAPSGGAASTPDPAPYRPVAFGTSTAGTGTALASPAWPVLVTCIECGDELHLDAVGYRQAVKRLVAQGWRYGARPRETARCPECLSSEGEGGRGRGAARHAPAGPAAREETRNARPGPAPALTPAGAADAGARLRGAVR